MEDDDDKDGEPIAQKKRKRGQSKADMWKQYIVDVKDVGEVSINFFKVLYIKLCENMTFCELRRRKLRPQ